MQDDSNNLLQHPRRNLGNRYRSQAEKFSRLATKDEARFHENMSWAEQSARQAILYDFTDENNWRCLADIKVILGDQNGLRAVLEDVFSILGRDPEHLLQLDNVDFMKFGLELLEATFVRDPLNPNAWWEMINSSDGSTVKLDLFVERCTRLDFSDQRANIVFGRRIERIRDAGYTDLFIKLARILLAHRPQNHELWMELGRLYERLSNHDFAWICYDHVQTLRPHFTPRNDYMKRLKSKMDGIDEVQTWTRPSVTKREEFLDQMVDLASRVSHTTNISSHANELTNDSINEEEQDLIALINQGNYSEAFFVARRLLAIGNDWALNYLEQAKAGLE